jgi:hypothetical protein
MRTSAIYAKVSRLVEGVTMAGYLIASLSAPDVNDDIAIREFR